MYYNQPQYRSPSLETLEHQRFEINLRNPPHVPNLQIDPNIQPYIPLIAGYVAKDLQDKAENSPPRTYYFNIAAANRFLNPEFDSIVFDAARYVNYLLYRTPNPPATYEEAAQKAATGMVAMRVAKRFMEDPYLQEVLHNRISPAMVENYRKAVESYQSLQTHFAQMYNSPGSTMQFGQPMQQNPMHYPQGTHPGYPNQQMGYPGYPQQPQHPQYPHGFGQPMGYPNQPQGFGHPPYNPGFNQPMGHPQYPQGQPMQYGQQPMHPGYPQQHMMHQQPNTGFQGHTGQVMQSGNRFQPMQPSGSGYGMPGFESFGRDYGSNQHQGDNQTKHPEHHQQGNNQLNDQYPGFTQSHEPNALDAMPEQSRERVEPYDTFSEQVSGRVNTEAEIDKLYELDSNVLSWKPSPNQPYMPAYDTKRFKAMLSLKADGSVIMVPVRLKKDNTVDYEKHKTQEIIRYEAALEAAKESIQEAKPNQEPETDETFEAIEDFDPNTHVSVSDLIEASSDEEAQDLHDLARKEFAKNNEDPLIFTTPVRVDTLLSDMGKNSQRFVNAVANARDLVHAKELVGSAYARESSKVADFVDEEITKALNKCFNIEMGLDGLRIDSFFEDYDDLIEHLANVYDPIYLERFLHRSKSLLRELFVMAPEEVLENYLEDVDPIGAGEELESRANEAGVVSLSRYYTITSVNLKPSEAGINSTDVGKPSAVIDSYQLFLSSLIDSVRGLDGDECMSNRIVFASGDIYEIDDAIMNDDLVLVTRVK